MKIQLAVLLCMVYFSMKLLGFVSKAIKLLLTELVSQCRKILPLAFSALTNRAIYSCTDLLLS